VDFVDAIAIIFLPCFLTCNNLAAVYIIIILEYVRFFLAFFYCICVLSYLIFFYGLLSEINLDDDDDD